MSLSKHSILPAVVEKCLVQYSPDSPPLLCGVPVSSSTVDDDSAGQTIRLAPRLLSKAVTTISEAFESHSNPDSPLIDNDVSEEKDTLPVTVLCSPDSNSLVAVDAAVRHIAYNVRADIVILDPSDLASGRQGIFGEELTDAFWQLYKHHYQELAKEEKEASKNKNSPRNKNTTSDGTTSDDEDQDESMDVDATENAKEEVTQEVKANEDNNVKDGAADKPEDSPYTRSTALVQDFFLVRSGVDCEVEKPLNRRRIFYLRDYGALCKALLPLLSALYTAAQSPSFSTTLVIAGISPIQRVLLPGEVNSRKSAAHQRFLSKMEGADLLNYLHSRYSPGWRRPEGGAMQYQSLEQLFCCMFANRYQGRSIARRGGYGDTARLQKSRQTEFRFTRVVRVALSNDPPGAVQDITNNDLRKRFLLANFTKLIDSNSTLQERLLQFYSAYCSEPDFVEGIVSKTWTALLSSVLDTQKLKAFEHAVLLSAKIEDALSTLAETEKDEAEWSEMLENAKGKKRPASSGPPSDPVVKRVRDTGTLSEHEKDLLGCVVNPSTIDTTFADVCVKPELVDTLRTTVMYPILFPEAYATGILAKESAGGVLLYGPPGTGKTMACRALAKECGARMLKLQSSLVRNQYVGEAEKTISAAFSLARRLGPCVLFIDEIDSLFSKRQHKSWERVLITEFAQEMDGITSAEENRKAGVIVVGATNKPQDLDSAVLRRLPRRVLVDLPNSDQRKMIISQYLKDEKCDDAIDLAKLASKTPLFSGSDLRHLVHAAALAALKDTLPKSSQIQFGTKGARPRPPLKPRVIREVHFDRALRQVAASAATNEDEPAELRRWEKELFQFNK